VLYAYAEKCTAAHVFSAAGEACQSEVVQQAGAMAQLPVRRNRTCPQANFIAGEGVCERRQRWRGTQRWWNQQTPHE